jgi:glycosyltransferase involved in cell wall biosynthesis
MGARTGLVLQARGTGMTTAPLRVLFVSPHARTGGAETYLERLVDALGEPWVAGIVCLQDGPFVERLRRRGRNVVVIDTGRHPWDAAKAGPALRRVIRRLRPAVVHANGVKAALVAEVATARLDVPVVWVKHDHSYDGTLATVAALRSAVVVGVSRSVVSALPAPMSSKVRLVPNGIAMPAVPPDAGRESLRRLMGVPLDTPVVGLVGRLHPVKGHADLIEAIPRIATAQPNVRFAFMGAPDDRFSDARAELECRAQLIDVAERITWLGYHESPLELMSGFDVAAMPSKAFRGRPSEGWPMSATELLALGVPVVAYRRGGIPEALGECGVLVDPDDAPALARAIERVLNDRDLRVRMRACGLERSKRFDQAAVVERMRAVYTEAAA